MIEKEPEYKEQPYEIIDTYPPFKNYHCEGVCPKCGYNDFDYIDDDGGTRDESWVTFKCRRCKTKFTEYSYKVYSHTNVDED